MPRLIATAALSLLCSASLGAQLLQPTALQRPAMKTTSFDEQLALDSNKDLPIDRRASWRWVAGGSGIGAALGGAATYFLVQIGCDAVNVPCNAAARKRSAVAFGTGVGAAAGAAAGATARWIQNGRR